MKFMQRRDKCAKHSIFEKAVSCAAVLAVMLVPVCAGAVEIQQSVYTASDENIIISGNISNAYGIATAMILPEGTTPETVTADIINSQKYVAKSVTADANGAFTLSATMPEWSASGTYTVYISDGDSVDNVSFTHFNSRMASIVVDKINKAASAAEVGTILNTDGAELAISPETLASYGTGYASGLYNGRSAGGYTVDTVMTELNRINAMCLLPGLSAEDAEKLISECDADFGFDYETDFKNKEKEVKAAVLADLAAADLTKASAGDIFYSSYLLSVINNSTSYMDVKEAVADYGDKIGLDLTEFKNLTDYEQGEVAQVLMNASPENINAVKTSYNAGIAAVADSGNNQGGYAPSGGGSSGGGGGGSYTSNFTVDTQTAGNISDEISGITFDDVVNHWSKEVVSELASKGIVTGFEDGSFRPDGYVTRAEFAKIIINALGIQTSTGSDFSDVNQNDWFYPYVYAAKNASLINGYEGSFRPNDRITREECAAIIYRALVRDGKTPEGTYEFADSSDIADYAKDCVSALAASGLLRGDGSSFAPKANTTRAEAASMIYNLLSYTERR